MAIRMGRIFRPSRLLGLLVLAALSVGCGVSEPPLPSAPIAVPDAVATVSAVATRIPATIPISAPTATATPSGSDGVTLTVSVAPAPRDIPEYNRRDWRHWTDADRDCQDARQEVLIAESQSAVAYEAGDECRVEGGDWFGAYTGESFTDPGDLDVDHMVPLANAHRSGGWAWSKERKAEYANDLSYANHLIAVQASANRQKGSKGPEDWMPPRRGYWCQYATDWVTIKHLWGLTANPDEASALREMLETCDEPTSLVIVPAEGASLPTSSPTSATTAATPTPMPSPDGELRYDPDGPDRDCGDFDTWEEAQAFYIAAGGPGADRHRLDSDDDGIACASLREN